MFIMNKLARQPVLGRAGPRRWERLRGFTLIELLIAMVVVAILTAIAYPSYMTYIQRARRSDATRALTEAAAAMERYFSQNQTYANATIGIGTTPVYSGTSPEGYYNLAFSAGPTANAYMIQATPVAGSTQASDPCGTFTIDQISTHGVNGGTLTDAKECWRMN